MNSVNSQGQTLLDYLQDPGKAKQQLQSLGESQQQSQQVSEDLTELTHSLSDKGDLNNLADKIKTGETSVSLKRLQNMVGFYSQDINSELNHQLSRFNLDQHQVAIEHSDGQWQVTADDAASEKQRQRLQNYLNEDQRLSNKMDQLTRLSSLSEWTQLQQDAATMKQEGTDKDKLVSLLSEGRETIMATRHFINRPDTGVALASKGLADGLMEALTGSQPPSS